MKRTLKIAIAAGALVLLAGGYAAVRGKRAEHGRIILHRMRDGDGETHSRDHAGFVASQKNLSATSITV